MKHDVVLASLTSEDRSKWSKAIHKKLKEMRAQLPTAGWLIKQGGRSKHGLSALFARDKRRWFVLTQPNAAEGSEATFRYYDGPPTPGQPIEQKTARGAVVLNRDARLAIDAESKRANAFRITSHGASDKRPVVTSLAAETNAELGRWMKALHAAIDASGGRVKDLKSLGKDHRGAAAGAKKPGGLARQASMERHRMMMQLAKLEREEVSQRAPLSQPSLLLRCFLSCPLICESDFLLLLSCCCQMLELKVKVLQDLAEYLGVIFERKRDKDKKWLVDHIISQRRTLEANEAVAHQKNKPGLKTWGSVEQMFNANL